MVSFFELFIVFTSGLTAGVTGKRGMWRTKPPDAESAFWGRFPESAANSPHLSGARGVRPRFYLACGYWL